MLSRREAWETIFARNVNSFKPCEWYYDLASEFVDDVLDSAQPGVLLHCGCGVYPLLDTPKYPVVINFDFAANVVNHISQNASAVFFIAVVCHLPVQDESVDAIIEKGLFDSMTADSTVQVDNAARILDEYCRVLRSGGIACILSIFECCGSEKDMLGLLCHSQFRVEYREFLKSPAEIPDQHFCFVYICRKQQDI
jgi:SAM-dependent methyltransferase